MLSSYFVVALVLLLPLGSVGQQLELKQLQHTAFTSLVDIPHSSSPPALAYVRATVDGQEVLLYDRISSGTHTLSIRYLGVDLRASDRIVYRYKLDGVDTAWREAGTETEATYANLRAGRYRFHVMASNGGRWSHENNGLSFTILPALYERPWFIGLCCLGILALLWAFYLVRTRQLSSQIELREEQRAAERVRIARDLHDTLLQGLQGLMLRFHVAAETIEPENPARNMLERALVAADKLMVEGRDRVNRLRSQPREKAGFEEEFQSVAAELNADNRIHFEITTGGDPVFLDPEVHEEMFSIGRESITNAFRHSYATKIVVSIEYSPFFLRISCIDNGRGIDELTAQAGSNRGRWGLIGMQERAQHVGASLCIERPTKGGTSVTVTLGARLAYGNGYVL